MDLMEDEDLKKSVIEKMMGELDDVTADSLKKPSGPVKGVEIAITVSPKTDDEIKEEVPEEMAEGMSGKKDDDDEEEEPESSNYISHLLKKLG